jgi:hypothetical protein
VIEWLKKRVKNHIAKASTKQFKSGRSIKMEKFKENGVLDAVLEYFLPNIKIM